MSLRILSVPFPFAPLRADPVGGAEQVAAALDAALVAAGHESIVIAPEGSQVAGTLVALAGIAVFLSDKFMRGVASAGIGDAVGAASTE